MPAAVPLAVMAAGAIASKVAASKQASKQNQNIAAANKSNTDFAGKMAGYGDEDRAYQTGLRGDITNQYWNLYNGLGQDDGSNGGGGGGGVAFTMSDPRMNEAMAGYRKFAANGGFDQGDIDNYRLRNSLNIPQFYQGIQRNLSNAANIRGGGYSGYSGQSALAARDAARQSANAQIQSEGSLQDMIRQNMFKGLEGVGQYDTEYMNNLKAFEQARMANANSNASRASSNSSDEYARKMQILGQLRGLRGESGSDLPYFSMAQKGYGSVTPEKAGQPWYGAAGDVAQGVAGAYMGGGSGIAGMLNKSKQSGVEGSPGFVGPPSFAGPNYDQYYGG